MTDELVKRLDQINQNYDFARGVHGTIREAKDRVQALQAQNLRLSGMVHDLTAERDRLREAGEKALCHITGYGEASTARIELRAALKGETP